MSINPLDVWARLGTAIKPPQAEINQGYEAGAASPYTMNWILKNALNSLVGNIHKWNVFTAAASGYVHPAIVIGSNNILYTTVGAGSDTTSNPVTDGNVNWIPYVSTPPPPLPKDYKSDAGLRLASYGVAVYVFEISAGSCRSSDNTTDMTVASAIGKDVVVPWTQGGSPASAGGGTPAVLLPLVNGQWYRIFLIAKPDGTTDMGIDTSSGAVNLLAAAAGAGYTKYRRVGYLLKTAAGIKPFYQPGKNRFEWINKTTPDYVQVGGLSTASRLFMPLFAPPNVEANITVGLFPPATGVGNCNVLITSQGQSDVAVVQDNATLNGSHLSAGGDHYFTNSKSEIVRNTGTSSAIYHRADPAKLITYTLTAMVNSWEDIGV